MTGWNPTTLTTCSSCLGNPSPHRRLMGTDTETCLDIWLHTGLTLPELGKNTFYMHVQQYEILTAWGLFYYRTDSYFHKCLLHISTGTPTQDSWRCLRPGLNMPSLVNSSWKLMLRWMGAPSARKWGCVLFAYGPAPFPASNHMVPLRLNDDFFCLNKDTNYKKYKMCTIKESQ